MRRRILASLIAANLFGLLFGGTVAAEGRFRADDGNFWHLSDNPALPAVSGDVLSLGVAVAPSQGKWDKVDQDVQLVSPLLSFRYAVEPSGDSVLGLGTAVGLGQGLALGYRTDESLSGSTRVTAHQFGAIFRPFDVVSGALTLDNAFAPSRVWGAGIGLRPLTLLFPRADWLTVTADGVWDGKAAALERLGGRLSWKGSDLRVWYEPGAKMPGFEVTLALGPVEASATTQRFGQAVRWSSQTPDLSSFGPKLLRIKAPGLLGSTPLPASLFGAPSAPNLVELVALLDQAAENADVRAVVFEDPPVVGGLAAAEELRQSIVRLQKAGKKVFVYAESYVDSVGFQGWLATADRLALHPTGSVWLTAGGTRRLYLKDFLDKVGIRFVNFAPWETKSANNTLTFSSMPEAERTMLKRFLGDREALAVQALQNGRGDRLKRSASELVAQGPWLVGREALELGLVDALESQADFEDFLSKEYPGASFADTLPQPREHGWGPTLSRSTVAVVHLAGDIVMGPGEAGRSVGRLAAESLASLRSNADVRAVILRVDSPGGTVTPSDQIAEEVKKTVAAGKPVLVVMGDLAASGGYYLSAPATRIWARPGTLTGSIGVTAAWFTGEKALDLLGVKADGVDMAPSSAFGDFTRPLADADGAKWKGMIEATYDRFLDVVAEGRHLEKAKLEPLARGQIYTGREALALGLVDELGGQTEAKAWLEKEWGGPVELIDVVPGEFRPWGALLGPLAKTVLQNADSPTLRLASSLDSLAAPWAEAVAGVAARGPGPLVWVDAP